ncbi:hypothetical protein QYM36_008002 [Artemia franciscana]|uniref:EXS domain-containing protein n=1 Tax=Artemia franciscana TaxID=6661 RepID=A0AA88IHE0_ARTSF|nr:hypothetical protein QYM36_008002 [Artemia franciscana]
MLKTEIGAKWREERVDTAQFYVDKSIDSLLADTETIYTEELESGDRQRAMKRLRVPPLGQVKPQEWTTFKVGLFFGAFIVLFIIVVLAGLWRRETISWNIFFRLYRGPFWIVLFVFFIAGNVSGWRRNGVNHVLIFELDPRSSLTDQHLFELAGLFGVLWCLSVLCFLYADILTVPPYVNPLMLIVIMIAFLFNPSRTFLHGARFWLLRVMGRMCIAPFAFVNFADFWIADQLNSLTRALADLHYLFCFYGTLNGNWYYQEENSKCLQELWWTRLLVLCLPAWFRLAQCLRRYKDSKEAFPHLANGLKYATSFGVVISSTLYGLYPNGYYYKEVDSSSSIRTLAGNLNKTALAQLINERIHSDQRSLSSIDEIEKLDNPFFISWLACLFISSLYAFIWDVKIDWGLFDSKTGENTLLREEIVYGSCWIYYAAIIQDFVIRFCWAISISLSEIDFVQKEVITTVFGTLEVFRRFVWNFFRLENEHLNNCGKFRAVRDISIVPLAISDQEEIIKMMDNDDFSVLGTTQQASAHLKLGGSADTAVVKAIAHLEDSPLTNAGYGSALNSAQRVECDASICRTIDYKFASVGALEGVQNPVAAAHRLLLHQEQELGTEKCTKFGIVPPRYFYRFHVLANIQVTFLDIKKNVCHCCIECQFRADFARPPVPRRYEVLYQL